MDLNSQRGLDDGLRHGGGAARAERRSAREVARGGGAARGQGADPRAALRAVDAPRLPTGASRLVSLGVEALMRWAFSLGGWAFRGV